jgi:hypothetical protein
MLQSKGFAKLGGKVTTQTVAGAKTVGNSPNGARLNPQIQSRRDVGCKAAKTRHKRHTYMMEEFAAEK